MASNNTFGKGQKVKWSWSGSDAYGTVAERFERDVECTLKGSKIIRRGSADNPAYLIKQGGGDQVLKLGSELEEA